ncbi:acyl carrier protein [Oleispirillum naphthae]|uniref:acyl carrier protein n=1 Tax=Oleispirillum naphthae TaxID=2838853 RepID=UPI0030824677
MPTEAEITETIVIRLRALVPPGVEIGPQTSIMGDLGLDSLTVMNFVMWLEDVFDVSLPMDRIVEMETVADLARALQSLGAKEAS